MTQSLENIETIVTLECMNSIIINAINSIRTKKMRPDEDSIFEFILKNTGNTDITKAYIEDRVKDMTFHGLLYNKPFNGRNSFYISQLNKHMKSDSNIDESKSNSPSPLRELNNLEDKVSTLQNTEQDFANFNFQNDSQATTFTPGFTSPKLDSEELSFIKDKSENSSGSLFGDVKTGDLNQIILDQLKLDIKDMFDIEFKKYKSKCNDWVEHSKKLYEEQIRSKDHMIKRLFYILENITGKNYEFKQET